LKYSKTLITGCSLLLLNGCLDVEDNNNNADVVQALNAQTAALENQQENENKVTFQALIIDSLNLTPVSSALVTVKVGSETVAEDLVVTDGKFEVSKLPANSDIEVIVSSAENAFVQRVFFMNTGDSGTGVAVKDFGVLEVSEPQEVQIAVLNNADNLAIDSLQFEAYSHVGSNSSFMEYKHTSTFDADLGIYSIIIPKDLVSSVFASVDVNKDGEADFEPESLSLSGTRLYIQTRGLTDLLTVYLADAVEEEVVEVEYRISLVDESANVILGAEIITIADSEVIQSTFDADTEQYVISADFDNNIELNVPAFTSGDVNYQSTSISFRDLNNGDLSVSVSGANSNCCYTIPNTEVIEIALIPRETNSSTNLEVVTKSIFPAPIDSSFSAFYSQAVTVPASSVSLTYRDGFSIVKGNDSADDVILPGTTLLTGGVEVPVTHTMSLNDTKLTVAPVTALTNIGSYEYSIGNIEVNATGEMGNVSDSLSFTLLGNGVLDINDVKLDNENYTTNGVSITSANTAGELSSNSNYDRSVYFYLPTSIQGLENFTMRQLLVTEDNVQRTNVRNYTLVSNGYISSNYRVGLVQLASNENVVRDNLYRSTIYSTAQPDAQAIYRVRNYEYMSDKTSTSDNSIAFEYAYETKAGEISTGTIVIPVQ